MQCIYWNIVLVRASSGLLSQNITGWVVEIATTQPGSHDPKEGSEILGASTAGPRNGDSHLPQ